jgi:beta-phosphoglucomutase-like phosphatase (HAD superfamily)
MPHECLAVEDSKKGQDAAQEAGINVYAVKNYYQVTLENMLNKINFFNRKEQN